MEPRQNDAAPVQRYRVVISDIRNFIQTMIATSINEIVTSGKLRKGSIVRLLKYSPQQVKDKKYVAPPSTCLVDARILIMPQDPDHYRDGGP